MATITPTRHYKKVRTPNNASNPALKKLFDFSDKLEINPRELATLAGIDNQSVYKYRQGRREPNVDIFMWMVEALGLRVEVVQTVARTRHPFQATNPLLVKIFSAQEDRGMTSSELSVRSGLNPAVISLVRRGKRNATIEEATRMADALGLKIELVDRHG